MVLYRIKKTSNSVHTFFEYAPPLHTSAHISHTSILSFESMKVLNMSSACVSSSTVQSPMFLHDPPLGVPGDACVFDNFGVPVSVVTPFNADFDGDEMNLHVAQGLQATAEVATIMDVRSRLISPKDGSPCVGLIQDGVLGAYLMTSPDVFIVPHRFFDLMMLVHHAGATKAVPLPAIIKAPGIGPRGLYTGRQLASVSLPQGLNAGKRDPAAEQIPGCVSGDSFWVRGGEVLQGRLCKRATGPKAGGLVHAAAHDLGQDIAAGMLSDLQRLTCGYMEAEGFSVGIDDCWAGERVHKDVGESASRAVAYAQELANEARTVSISDPTRLEALDAAASGALQDALGAAGKIVSCGVRGSNAFAEMVMAGSKGSALNITQIMGCVGQQTVNGRRVGPGLGGRRTLPCFPQAPSRIPAGALGPMERGFCFNNYVTGLCPQEMFFHAMGGREGLVDTAVKTATTGYLARSLNTMLEHLVVAYDGSVRGTSGELYATSYSDGFASEALIRSGGRLVPADIRREWIRVRQRRGLPIGLNLGLGLDMDKQDKQDKKKGPTITKQLARVLGDASIDRPEASTFRTHILEAWPHDSKEEEEALEELADVVVRKANFARVEAGTAVGAIAASSISAPATQMVLNTFHTAGVQNDSVSRGVPYLIAQLTVSKDPKWSFMDVAVEDGIDPSDAARASKHIRLSDLLCMPPSEIREHDALHMDERFAVELEGQLHKVWRIVGVGDVDDEDIDQDLDQEDQDLDEAFDQKDQDLDEEDQERLPPLYDMRFELSRERMSAEGLDMLSVRRALTDYFVGRRIACTHELDDVLVARVSCDPSFVHTQGDGVEAEVAASKIRIKGIPGVLDAARTADNRFRTVGASLMRTCGRTGVDVRNTRSNDPHQVWECFGIEAAMRSLYDEIYAVLTFDGGAFNPRHLWSLVSVMCHSGTPQAVNRYGMRGMAPLHRASFEETVKVFNEAAVFAADDPCLGITDANILGKLAPVGTGYVRLLQESSAEVDEDATKDATKDAEVDAEVDADAFVRSLGIDHADVFVCTRALRNRNGSVVEQWDFFSDPRGRPRIFPTPPPRSPNSLPPPPRPRSPEGMPPPPPPLLPPQNVYYQNVQHDSDGTLCLHKGTSFCMDNAPVPYVPKSPVREWKIVPRSP